MGLFYIYIYILYCVHHIQEIRVMYLMCKTYYVYIYTYTIWGYSLKKKEFPVGSSSGWFREYFNQSFTSKFRPELDVKNTHTHLVNLCSMIYICIYLWIYIYIMFIYPCAYKLTCLCFSLVIRYYSTIIISLRFGVSTQNYCWLHTRMGSPLYLHFF